MELLASLLQKFVSGEDRSKELVDEIEAVLLKYFEDSELYEELAVPVASYNPRGGEFLYDEEALAKGFAYALKRLGEDGEIS